MGGVDKWTALLLVVVALMLFLVKPYLDRRRTYQVIPPEDRTRWDTWPCPSCGAHNHPDECSEDGRRVRGVCSACKKRWDGK